MQPRTTSRDRDGGFTLIELLVVVVILGILIAIAIPVYLNYRRSANDKAAQSDLRSATSVLELCLASNGSYPSTGGVGSGATMTPCAGQTVSLSPGTTVAYYPAADASSYIVGATNTSGSGKNYCFHSSKGGGVVSTGSAVMAYRLTC